MDKTDLAEIKISAEGVYDSETGTLSEYTPPEPEPTPEPPLSETEQAILDTAINVDYLVCMKELEIWKE